MSRSALATLDPLPIAADALDDRWAFIGRTGMGKTYAAKFLAERVIRAGHRIAIVDPLGVWWGLRAGRDGTAKGGLPVQILGGLHADVAIGEHHGAAIGKLVSEAAMQCVIDLKNFPSAAARRRFMRAFLETIAERNTEPLHLVLDEADMFAPQNPMPDQVALGHLVSEIARRGRVDGFIAWLLSQRPAVLHKNVLSQASILVAMGLTSSQDRAAIKAWITGSADQADEKRVLGELPGLPRGDAFLWAPSYNMLERVTFPAITTFDSSRTPKRGERVVGADLAKINAAAIAAALDADTASPTAETRRTVRPAPADAVGADQLAAAYEKGRTAGRVEGAAQALRDVIPKVAALLAELELQSGRATANAPAASDQPPQTREPVPARPAAPTRAVKAATSDLHSAARAILTVLAPRAPVRLTWRQVSTLAGLSPRGGHWETGRRQLRDLDLVAEDRDGVYATPAGVTRIGGVPQAPASREEKRALWCEKLGSPGADMLRTLAASREPMAWTALAERLGKAPRGGHWETGRRKLRDNELVVETADGVTVVEELRDV